MKILIIEDEKELANDIAEYLSSQNYICEFASTFNSALEKIEMYDYDCILLDIMLPGGSGLDLLSIIKKRQRQYGVIITSAKNALEDKIIGLQIGADDYLAKPFHLSELAARIYAIIRRNHFENNNILKTGEIEVDILAKSVKVNNTLVTLTRKEFDLMLFFIGNKNRVISKSALAEHLSGDFADMLDNHDVIYAHVKNLKKKLYEAGCPNYIKTIYGTGYKWEI